MISRRSGMECPRCGHERDRATAAFCPRCGYDYRSEWHRPRGPVRRFLGRVWFAWFRLTGWFIIARLWRIRWIGKGLGMVSAIVWAFIVLIIVALIVGPQKSTNGSTPSMKIGAPVHSAAHISASLPGRVSLTTRTVQVGRWQVHLSGYSLATHPSAALPGISAARTEWLVTFWTLRNVSHAPDQILPLDFHATSGGVERAGDGLYNDGAVAAAGGHAIGIPYVMPGRTITGGIAAEVFRNARFVTVTFEPLDSFSLADTVKWRIPLHRG